VNLFNKYLLLLTFETNDNYLIQNENHYSHSTTWKGPQALRTFLSVFVNHSLNFVNTQMIVIKLVDIHDHIPHQVNVSDFKFKCSYWLAKYQNSNPYL